LPPGWYKGVSTNQRQVKHAVQQAFEHHGLDGVVARYELGEQVAAPANVLRRQDLNVASTRLPRMPMTDPDAMPTSMPARW
jgi:hypothetical protein